MTPEIQSPLVEAVAKVAIRHALLGETPERVGGQAAEVVQIALLLLGRGGQQDRLMTPVALQRRQLTDVTDGIDRLASTAGGVADEDLVGLEHLVLYAVMAAVALGPGDRLAAEGRAVQGDGPDPGPAGAAQIHAVTGRQPAGEGDDQFAMTGQGLDEQLFPGLKGLIVSPIQHDNIGIHDNSSGW
ncbi:hypothetical protein D3C72_1451000 [compost metagenome]